MAVKFAWLPGRVAAMLAIGSASAHLLAVFTGNAVSTALILGMAGWSAWCAASLWRRGRAVDWLMLFACALAMLALHALLMAPGAISVALFGPAIFAGMMCGAPNSLSNAAMHAAMVLAAIEACLAASVLLHRQDWKTLKRAPFGAAFELISTE